MIYSLPPSIIVTLRHMDCCQPNTAPDKLEDQYIKLLPTVTVILRPQVVDAQHTNRDIKHGQNRQAVFYNRSAFDKQALEEGDTVRLQPFTLGRKDCSKGTVFKRLDERSYVIDTPKRVVRRNRQRLKKTTDSFVQQPTGGALDIQRTAA